MSNKSTWSPTTKAEQTQQQPDEAKNIWLYYMMSNLWTAKCGYQFFWVNYISIHSALRDLLLSPPGFKGSNSGCRMSALYTYFCQKTETFSAWRYKASSKPFRFSKSWIINASVCWRQTWSSSSPWWGKLCSKWGSGKIWKYLTCEVMTSDS